MNNYTVYHLHSDYSLLDSCTKFEEYVNKAVELGQKAIASTEHGNIFNWVKKKEYCDSKGIKYIHGCEIYLTHKLYHKRKVLIENKSESYVEIADKKIKDNYHTILLAKNQEGIKEINSLVSKSYNNDYFYFKPRISFDDFLNISDNIISTSACLASPLWSIQETILKNNQEIKISENELQDLIKAKESSKYKSDNSKLEKIKNKIEVLEFNIQEIKKENDSLEYYFDKLLHKYTYLEVQPHINSEKQKKFNKQLVEYHNKYGIPLVAGTDTHSLNDYKAQCRTILQTAKHIEFLDEDTFDLTYKSYEEIYNMFKKQNILSDDLINEALSNTNVIADSVEDFELDKSFKYPILKSKEEDEAEFVKRCWDKLEEKIKNKIIDIDRKSEYVNRINEELSVFKKVGMLGFMLSMSDFIGESRNEGIPFGFSRGSAGGSLCAYLTDINDIDPIIFDTNFARFCNEDRIESGD